MRGEHDSTVCVFHPEGEVTLDTVTVYILSQVKSVSTKYHVWLTLGLLLPGPMHYHHQTHQQLLEGQSSLSASKGMVDGLQRGGRGKGGREVTPWE